MCDLFCEAAGLDQHTKSTNQAVRYKQRSFSEDWEHSDTSEGGVDSLEITGDGTKLMKSLKLPTVLVRVRNRELLKSRVCHVLLETESKDFPRQIIPAIMLSDASSCWRTQLAELFPLYVKTESDGRKSITPLLHRRRYKQLFLKGCSFKILALESGRSIDSAESVPWNQWKLNLPGMRDMITEILYKDIVEMPVSMIRRATQCRTQNSNSISSTASLVLCENSSCSSQELSKRVLSAHYPNLILPGVTASGGSSFATWFKVLPPDITVDENFSCDRGTTLRKDRFVNMETFYRYLRLTDTE